MPGALGQLMESQLFPLCICSPFLSLSFTALSAFPTSASWVLSTTPNQFWAFPMPCGSTQPGLHRLGFNNSHCMPSLSSLTTSRQDTCILMLIDTGTLSTTNATPGYMHTNSGTHLKKSELRNTRFTNPVTITVFN